MRSLVKIVHLISLCVFFGSIATYIFLGELILEDNQQALALNREWILVSTTYLTITAMCLTGISGFFLSGKPRKMWVKVKILGSFVVFINTIYFVYPAIKKSAYLLRENEQGFQSALVDEAIFGGVNVVLILFIISVAVFKPKLNKTSY